MASPIPLLSINSGAYHAGLWAPNFLAQLSLPLLNPIRSLSHKVTAQLDRIPTVGKIIRWSIPYLGLGLVSATAYYAYPRSKVPAPMNCFFQGLIWRMHEHAIKFFLYHTETHPYTIQQQIYTCLHMEEWVMQKRDTLIALEYIEKWSILEAASNAEVNLDGILSLVTPTDTYSPKTVLTSSVRSILRNYYSHPAKSMERHEIRENMLILKSLVPIIQLCSSQVSWYAHAHLLTLFKDNIPIAITDRCCSLFYPLYLFRKCVSYLPFQETYQGALVVLKTCNRDLLLAELASEGINTLVSIICDIGIMKFHPLK